MAEGNCCGSDGRVCLQCRRPGFDLWVGKIPWRRAWQPTPVFLPGKFHGQRSLVSYSPKGLQKSWTQLRDYIILEKTGCYDAKVDQDL